MESCWGAMVRSDGWMALSFVKGILGVLVVVVIVLFMFSCLVKCLQKSIGEAFLTNTGRGVVEACGPARGFPGAMPWKNVCWTPASLLYTPVTRCQPTPVPLPLLAFQPAVNHI